MASALLLGFGVDLAQAFVLEHRGKAQVLHPLAPTSLHEA
jgi:hypothetical protein